MSIYPSGTVVVGRYEVVQGPHEKPSLAGGMGLVYLCVDHRDNGRPVALKTFRPEYLPNREARDRFLREGSTWVELGYHPHIVRCYQVAKPDIGSEVFLVLQLIAAAEGKRDASLRAWLTPGKPLPLEQALLFALHIARGMRFATTRIPGLVHRDLKPENILAGRDGLARITDLGLAKALGKTKKASNEFDSMESDGTGRQRTLLTRGIAGTPRYMSPEQCAGETLDARSDIYAFGCILYEMLSGKFAITGNNIKEITTFHRNNPEYELPPDLPAELGMLLKSCLAAKPLGRYRNWEELSYALEIAYEAVNGKPAPARVDDSEEEDTVAAGWSYNALGLSYMDIGNFEVAIRYFERTLEIGRTEEERLMEAAGLGNLASAYLRMGDAKKAIEFYKQDLAIIREMGERQSESIVLGNLGNAYRQLGDVHAAINFYQQSLSIAHELGDRYSEGNMLSNLGNAHSDLGDIRKAIEFYEKHLTIAREFGDRRSECAALGNLGGAYQQLGKPVQAIELFKDALIIMREIGDRHGEGLTLDNLGLLYKNNGDLQQAIQHYNQALPIIREVGDRYAEVKSLGNLGVIYNRIGNPSRAIEYLEKALSNAREIGDRRGEGLTWGNLGNVYMNMGNIIRAKECYEQDLAIAREIDDRHGEGYALGNLGNAYKLLGDSSWAIEYFEQHLTIARELGDMIGAAMTSGNLALLLYDQGRYTEALSYAEFARDVFIQAQNIPMVQRANQLIAQIQSRLR
ncbi:MAG: hypothetical protein CV087_16070 [Candidatus Brocadia sp. WS118]|nr:MAG: hypothetical protein CV087_16070 [Candidatus Brocadia sp. WS118]